MEKDVAVTIPQLPECGGGDDTSIDLVFHDVLHLISTDTSFHFTETQTGTFVTRSASGEALNSGHFTTTLSFQGPRDPVQTFTSNLIANGRSVDGTPVQVHLIEHATANANGDLTVDFTRASCG